MSLVATQWLTLSGVVEFAVPGSGLRQAAQAFVVNNGPIGAVSSAR